MRAIPALVSEITGRGVALPRSVVTPRRAQVAAASRTLTREQRLEIWAAALERCGELTQLQALDAVSRKAARKLRCESSALGVACREPALRAEGLRGDTLGAAMEFFGLTPAEAHRIVCECGCPRVQTGPRAAATVRRIARARRANRAAALLACGLGASLILLLAARLFALG